MSFFIMGSNYICNIKVKWFHIIRKPKVKHSYSGQDEIWLIDFNNSLRLEIIALKKKKKIIFVIRWKSWNPWINKGEVLNYWNLVLTTLSCALKKRKEISSRQKKVNLTNLVHVIWVIFQKDMKITSPNKKIITIQTKSCKIIEPDISRKIED